ncbi:MAG TPA: thioredoxin family protein [Polyangium sp.]|nr:thioredoxin family protein [Polyangium sp.]
MSSSAGQVAAIRDTLSALMLMRMNGFLSGALSVSLALVSGCKHDEPTSAAPAASTTTAAAPAASAHVAPATSASAAANAEHHVAPPWFDGTPEQAFARAKQDGALIFLYWGAVWCPPCNELKSQVFNKPQFADLVRGFVPVYLDGDTSDAQRLGETFKISGYPTIVILSPEREELLRLGGSLDAEEIERALASVRARGQTFKSAIERVDAKKPTDADCNLLAHAAWELLPEDQWPPAKIMTSVRAAVDACPAKLARERALLTATLVGYASTAGKDPAAAPIADEIKTKINGYFDVMFADAESAWSARSFINNRAEDTATWLEGKKPTPVTSGWKAKWLEATKSIRDHKDVSVDTRLSSYLPMLEFEHHANPDKPVSEATKTALVAAVDKADADAKTPYERHTVITGAAFLLRQVGLVDRAKAMLLAEAEKTDTPFYYYSSLASQEKALGHMDEARKWSKKARESANGRATRLQWIAQDVQMNAKPNSPDERKYLLELADEFYKLALTLDDGFLGRNRMRAKQIRQALEALPGDEGKELLARHKAACEKLGGTAQEPCRKHFE